jgi:hypothetical protein
MSLVLCQFTTPDRSPNFSLDRQDKSWTPTRQNKVYFKTIYQM